MEIETWKEFGQREPVWKALLQEIREWRRDWDLYSEQRIREKPINAIEFGDKLKTKYNLTFK